MKFGTMKRYPEYKESGVAGIGKIPANWKMINTKYLFRLVTEPAPQDNDYELLSIYTSIGVKPRKELEERGNRATTTDGYWSVKKGDFIVNKLLAWMGAIGLSDYEGVTSPAYDILRKIQPLNERFYEYLFRCGLYFTEFKKWSKGIMEVRLRLYFDQFGQIPLVFPPVDDQNKIVDFLDQKTGQIDELLHIKERRIELLQEQRTALINQAVTKGLNPTVEMKSSGVEWIGEIPKDREVTRLKYICESIVDCEHKTAPTQETGYPLIRTPNIGIGHLMLDGVNRVSEAIYQEWSRRTIPQSGDLILAREAPVGNVAIIPKDLKVCLGQRTVLIRPDKNKVCSMFLVYLMLGNEIQAKLLGRSTGAIVHHLNMADIRNLELPRLSSFSTQRKIVDFLNRKTKQIDELITTEQRKIELLKEYRQSLISEAVTGKIDVRNEV